MLVAEAAVARWIGECCEVGVVDGTTAIADLHASWMDWSRGYSCEPVGKRRLARILAKRRFARCRLPSGARAHCGLALRGAGEVLRTADNAELRKAVDAWIEDCCVRNRAVTASVGDLYESWRVWAEGTDEFADKRAFCRALAARGYRRCRLHGGQRAFCGLWLKVVGEASFKSSG